jgi:myo-inositol-1(or 4)-monophosphatase
LFNDGAGWNRFLCFFDACSAPQGLRFAVTGAPPHGHRWPAVPITTGRILSTLDPAPLAHPDHFNTDELLTEVINAARAAGECIQSEACTQAELKTDGSPATAADHAADSLLRGRLTSFLPEAAWLSEETADSVMRLSRDLIWIVDPLDGTKEFIQGKPEYAVAIALVERQRPVLAVVHNPATLEMFWAVRGRGAFLNGERIATAPGQRLLASRSEVRLGEFTAFESEWDVSPIGSIQYKLALVACGAGALTFSRGPKHEWDVCAGSLLVTEAGGIATDLFGGELLFNRPFPKTRGVLAGHPSAITTARGLLDSLGGSERMAELETAG